MGHKAFGVRNQILLVVSLVVLLLLLSFALNFISIRKYEQSIQDIKEISFHQLSILNRIELNAGLNKIAVLHHLLERDYALKKSIHDRIDSVRAQNDALYKSLNSSIQEEAIYKKFEEVVNARETHFSNVQRAIEISYSGTLTDVVEYEDRYLRQSFSNYINGLSDFSLIIISNTEANISKNLEDVNFMRIIGNALLFLGLIILLFLIVIITRVINKLRNDYILLKSESQQLYESKQEVKVLNKQLEKRIYFLIESMPLMVWTTEPSGGSNYFSKNWKEYTGLDLEQLKGFGWMQVIHPEEAEENKKAWERAVKNKTFFRFEHRLKRYDGSFLYHLTHANPMLDKNGEITLWVGATINIHGRKVSERYLLNSHEELKKLNSELDNFVYSISHDFRAPLTNIMGMAHVGRSTEETIMKNEVFNKIMQSAKRLDDYILNVLDFSRNTRLDLERVEILFQKVIQRAWENYKYLQGAGKIQLLTDIKAEATFYSDKRRLETIFNNLISNAIKYADFSKPTPCISIFVTIHTKEVDITFEDNGIGIGEAQLGKVFDIFYRASETNQGSGLGLYIVKEVVEKLGGNLKIASKLGVGTSFFIKLPNL
jgi:PAS domain S-box-containing protein